MPIISNVTLVITSHHERLTSEGAMGIEAIEVDDDFVSESDGIHMIALASPESAPPVFMDEKPTIAVTAPSTLPEGYQFSVEDQNRTLLVRVVSQNIKSM